MSIRLDLPTAELRDPPPPATDPAVPAPRDASAARDERSHEHFPHTVDPAQFETLLRTVTPHAWVTTAIVTLTVVVFLAMVARGVSAWNPAATDVLAWGAEYAPRTLGGQPWRLLTSTFLHFGVLHLVLNMAALWDTGRLVERLFGHARFAAIYLAAGVAGSIASLVVHPFLVCAGASGAVFGVYGALGAFLIRERGAIPAPVLTKLGRVASGFIAYNIVFGLIQPNVDAAAHLGGLVGGAAAGAWLSLPVVPGRSAPARGAVIAAALALALAGAAVAAVPAPLDVVGILERFASDEHWIVTTYDDLVRRARDKELSEQQFATELDATVLPRWREARGRLPEVTRWPPAQQQMAGLLLHYAKIREYAWSTLVRAIDQRDAKLLNESQAFAAEADAVIAELNAEQRKR